MRQLMLMHYRSHLWVLLLVLIQQIKSLVSEKFIEVFIYKKYFEIIRND